MTAPTPDSPLYSTPQITTDDDGRHWDEQGREYRVVYIDGETAYELLLGRDS